MIHPVVTLSNRKKSLAVWATALLLLTHSLVVMAQDEESARDAAANRNTTASNSAAADLALETIRELDPQTPSELLRAVETLLNVSQPAIAAEYLQKLVSQDPSDTALIEVYRDLGPAFFIRLTQEPGLGAEASTFARRVLAASRNAVTDPRRIRELLEQLQRPDPDVRAAAIGAIAEAGSAAVGELLPVLDATRGTAAYEHLRTAMQALGRDAHGPLLGALQSSDSRIQAAAIRSLADLGVQTSIPFLGRPALVGDSPDVQVAAQAALAKLGGPSAGSPRSNAYLATVIRRLLRDGFSDPSKRPIVVWSWGAKNKSLVSTNMPPADAAAYFAAWLAGDLYQLEPKNGEFERLYITAQLAAAKIIGGLDVSVRQSHPDVYARLAQLPAGQFEAVLEAELTHSEAAAIGAAELLGHMGSESTLTGRGTSPLAKALLHGDPRVRFATVQAIVRLDPIAPYPGAADFWQQLGRFARTEGIRRVLIVHSQAAEADSLAGMANDLDFRADAVGTHQAAMKLAIRQPDFEAILISDAVELWTELLQQIRRDPRTSRIPVGLIARSQSMVQAERLARRDPLTVAFPLPYEPKYLAIALQNTLNQESISRIDVETRLEQGRKALGWLADFVADRRSYSFYNILDQESTLIGALAVTEFAPRAAAALGDLGTPNAQQALVDLASQNSRPIELRHVASKAFQVATRRRGVQLTTKQVLAQYDRYNTSQSLDETTQQILGSILDSIESAGERTSVFETVDTP